MKDTENHLNIVYKFLLENESILLDMRRGEGLNDSKYKKLLESINYLTEQYRNSEVIPKKLALCFIDISNYFYFNKQLYSTEEQNKLEDAAHKISELANALFSD